MTPVHRVSPSYFRFKSFPRLNFDEKQACYYYQLCDVEKANDCCLLCLGSLQTGKHIWSKSVYNIRCLPGFDLPKYGTEIEDRLLPPGTIFKEDICYLKDLWGDMLYVEICEECARSMMDSEFPVPIHKRGWFEIWGCLFLFGDEYFDDR